MAAEDRLGYFSEQNAFWCNTSTGLKSKSDGFKMTLKHCLIINSSLEQFYWKELTQSAEGCSSPVVKITDHGRHVISSSPVPLKTRRVGQRFTLNLSREETFSRWCGVVVRRGGASSDVVHVT
ncbi:uncharacterized protein TNCV_375491 [Trichonephila clavipes]|nr:uncharacterized protein TNCV_375491 [Trichonephila clavipes]